MQLLFNPNITVLCVFMHVHMCVSEREREAKRVLNHYLGISFLKIKLYDIHSAFAQIHINVFSMW